MQIHALKSRLYYLTPDPTPETSELCALVQQAVEGGVGMVQYRAKGLSTARMLCDARALLAFLRPARVPLLINDRLDVALAACADGVHVGQDDMPVEVARRMMGPRAIIGVTCKTLAQAAAAQRHAASYVSVGPVFPSPTKPTLPAIGLERLSQTRLQVSLPICAIGGDHGGERRRAVRGRPRSGGGLLRHQRRR